MTYGETIVATSLFLAYKGKKSWNECVANPKVKKFMEEWPKNMLTVARDRDTKMSKRLKDYASALAAKGLTTECPDDDDAQARPHPPTPKPAPSPARASAPSPPAPALTPKTKPAPSVSPAPSPAPAPAPAKNLSVDPIIARLDRLKSLRDNKVLTDVEYELKRDKTLDSI